MLAFLKVAKTWSGFDDSAQPRSTGSSPFERIFVARLRLRERRKTAGAAAAALMWRRQTARCCESSPTKEPSLRLKLFPLFLEIDVSALSLRACIMLLFFLQRDWLRIHSSCSSRYIRFVARHWWSQILHVQQKKKQTKPLLECAAPNTWRLSITML